jgi:hypothetical protein
MLYVRQSNAGRHSLRYPRAGVIQLLKSITAIGEMKSFATAAGKCSGGYGESLVWLIRMRYSSVTL